MATRNVAERGINMVVCFIEGVDKSFPNFQDTIIYLQEMFKKYPEVKQYKNTYKMVSINIRNPFDKRPIPSPRSLQDVFEILDTTHVSYIMKALSNMPECSIDYEVTFDLTENYKDSIIKTLYWNGEKVDYKTAFNINSISIGDNVTVEYLEEIKDLVVTSIPEDDYYSFTGDNNGSRYIFRQEQVLKINSTTPKYIFPKMYIPLKDK